MLILAANVFFLPLSIKIIITGGGSWGLSLIVLLLTVFTNLFLLLAIAIFRKKGKENTYLLITNIVGLCWIILVASVFHDLGLVPHYKYLTMHYFFT